MEKLSICQKKETQPHTSYKNWLKWIIDLNIKHKTIQSSENNIRSLLDLGFGEEFLDPTSIAQSINKQHLIN